MGISDEQLEGTNAPSITPADRSRLPSIIVFSKEGREEYDIAPGGSLTIGRSRECDVQIDQKSISRRHATIYGTSPLEIEDLGSSNGTWLNGKRLDSGKRVRLSSMSYLELGTVVVIVNSGSSSGIRAAELISGGPEGGSNQPSMALVRERIELVSKSTISVIILGETGVGKEVVAETIFRKSVRANKPFVCINCAALPDTLLESELFGFEPGAFSGATRAKPGLLETAHGGTIFFDEVGEMSLLIQAKLLRALETREVTRLGGIRSRALDVRFLSATNRNLQTLVSEGRFRGDLYFRLEGIMIVIPPLRERGDEIPDLVETFVRAACQDAGRPALKVADSVIAKLQTFPWPGNVRQLKNVVERAVLLCGGDTIEPSHISLDYGSEGLEVKADKESSEGPPVEGPLQEVTGGKPLLASQRKIILETLEMCGGNQSRAARLLGISRGTLLKRLDVFSLPRPRKKKKS